MSASEEIVAIPGLPKRRKDAERLIEEPSGKNAALKEMHRLEAMITS